MAEWQPIETAPRDGTTVLLCKAGYRPTSGAWLWTAALKTNRDLDIIGDGVWMAFDPEGVFEDDDALADYLLNSEYTPTHWMPLPDPPEST